MTDSRVAIMTGASGGIGAAVARRLHIEGYRLVLMSRSGCGAIAEELGAVGVSGSVLIDDDIQALADRAMQEFGRIDAAVYGAGRYSQVMAGYELSPSPPATRESLMFDPGYKIDLFDIPWPAWHDDFEMMVLGAMRLTKAVLPIMRQQKGGAIVAISGIEAAEPRAPFPLGPIRLALHGFAKLIADQNAAEGIRINCVAPGLLENAATEFQMGWENLVPMARYGGLDELAGTIAFLLSPEAGYITGQTITADGGLNRGLGI